ncbi:MAG: dTDP-4-dehydrorhamnose reductase [Candidatus Omnitrophota bacterium]
MTKKILITGAGGMLGTDLVKALAGPHDLYGLGLFPAPHLEIPYTVCDLSDPGSFDSAVKKFRPDLVFHLAAMTQVDLCESERENAYRHNVLATRHLVNGAAKTGAFLIAMSTEYVFDGAQKRPYTEEDKPHPVSYYGETKWLAEQEVLKTGTRAALVRISWLYGKYGTSFPSKILERSQKASEIKVVSDQIGCPTYTRDVASALARLVADWEGARPKLSGQIFHLSNQEPCSWYDFACHVLEKAGRQGVKVIPIASEALRLPAKRPANSVMSNEKFRRTFGFALRSWKEALPEFFQEMNA